MNEFEYINPLWRLADPLTVEQAAALIAGYDPNVIRYNAYGDVYFQNESGFTDYNGAHWVQTALAALRNAVNSGKLKARLIFSAEPRYEGGMDNTMERYRDAVDISLYEDGLTGCEFIIKNIPDWNKTLIGRDYLREWLISNGMKTGFFFPDSTDAPDYLDPNNPRYAPKLAAAVQAWLAAGEDVGNNGKSVKQSLMKWLREHAANYKLSDEEGKPNETGIEECAKVANWQDKGGAPKTPGG